MANCFDEEAGEKESFFCEPWHPNFMPCLSKRLSRRQNDCAKCGRHFEDAAALVKHMEKKGCYGWSNKEVVNRVRDWEQKSGNPNLLTLPCVGGQNTNNDAIDVTTRAIEESFDGHSYVCHICCKKFVQKPSLEQHLRSNVHEPSNFRCRKCKKTFKELSALVGHLELKVCGAIKEDLKLATTANNPTSMLLTN